MGRLLAADLARDRAPGSLFAALDAAGGRAAPLQVQITLDGVPHEHPALRRALEAQLNRYREAAAPPDDSPTAPVLVELRLARRDRELHATLAARRGAEVAHGSADPSWRVPDRGALLPPLLAVCVALLFQRTLLALFAGIYGGAVLLAADAGPLWAPLRGLVDVFSVYLRRELLDGFRAEVIGFIVALIAMVGVMNRAGGIRGLLDRLRGFARSVRSSLLLTYAAGLAIFFDDYANCMLVGSTMRPLTDRMRISREKLAYVVDSTAAPVAGVSLLSTWIAFQVSVYSAQLAGAGIEASGYEIFLLTLPYRFYCWLTLLFVLLVIVSGRDFGPMARAEARARREGLLVRRGGRPPISDGLARIEPAAGLPHDWRLAAVPLGATVLVTLARIFADGGGIGLLVREPATLGSFEGLLDVLLAGSGAAPVFTGALAGLATVVFMSGSLATRAAVGMGSVVGAVAGALGPASMDATLLGLAAFALVAAPLGLIVSRLAATTRRPHLDVGELRRAAVSSASTLAFAVVLLFEAWMIGAVCADLGTADYLVALLSDALPPAALPILLFVVACLVAFATGSSWSTMSILLPNVVGLAASLGAESALGSQGMVVLCVSAVLEGAIFGDHCSPISDTTVISSVASGSDHIDHVRTQAPYALAVAAAALLAGYAPVLFVPGFPPALGLALGAALLFAGLLGFGRHAPTARLAGAPDLE